MGISAFLITYNEESKIGRALDALRWTDEQIVVDGGSSDQTVEICRSKGTKVFQRKFDNFADQKNYALSLASHEWVLSIDADEVVSPQLALEIQTVLSSQSVHSAFRFHRQNRFLGKRLRFGRQGNEWITRLFRKEKGRFLGVVHEIVQINGSVGKLKGVLEHYGTESLEAYFSKLNLYIPLEVARMSDAHYKPSVIKAAFAPLIRWFVDYVLFGGFLDGRSGFLYHALSCYYGWLKNFRILTLKETACHSLS